MSMKRMTYLNVLLLLVVAVVDGATWYVSHSGINTDSCGSTREIQCETIDYILDQLGDGDIIQIDGTNSDANFYTLCNNALIDVRNKSLTFEGVNGVPRIGCPSWHTDDHIATFANGDVDLMKTCTILIKNIVIENGVLTFYNSDIEIRNVTFHNATIRTDPDLCESISIYIKTSKFYGKSRCDQHGECLSTAPNNITCNALDVSIHRSEFYQTAFVVDSRKKTTFFADGIKVANAGKEAQHLGGLYLTFSAEDAKIYIKDSNFTDQLHPSRVKSVTNLFEASIWLKVRVYIYRNNIIYMTLLFPYLHELSLYDFFIRIKVIRLNNKIYTLQTKDKQDIYLFHIIKVLTYIYDFISIHTMKVLIHMYMAFPSL